MKWDEPNGKVTDVKHTLVLVCMCVCVNHFFKHYKITVNEQLWNDIYLISAN